MEKKIDDCFTSPEAKDYLDVLLGEHKCEVRQVLDGIPTGMRQLYMNSRFRNNLKFDCLNCDGYRFNAECYTNKRELK